MIQLYNQRSTQGPAQWAYEKLAPLQRLLQVVRAGLEL